MTNMDFLINYVNPEVKYETTPADYILVDLVNDYLIWTKGDAIVKDLMTHEPTSSELNAAATVIDESLAVIVALCLLMDYSHDIGGAYYTHKVLGMGENKQYVYCFSFDDDTATEPQLEAWDSALHTTILKNVLGLGTAIDSMVKAVCTTNTLPGSDWAGAPLAGASNVLLLNDGNGALVSAADLYSNLKIKIPAAYATPAVETFILTVRYTYA